MAAKERKSTGRTYAPTLHNRKARFKYHVLEVLEAGIALHGTEVKSVRDSEVSLDESFARINNGELWLFGCRIAPYVHGDPRRAPVPDRPRKLLVHRRQIHALIGQVSQKGITLVPLSMYFKKGRVKVEVALVRGKREFDKRESMRKKEQGREMDRAMRRRR